MTRRTIDANPFRDSDGKLYLYYKSDGNAVRKASYIWGQQLSADGLKVVGEAKPLIKDDAKWEWGLVEAPAMVRSPGGYQMFYSAAFFGWDPNERLSRYATGYAVCAAPLGPCKDAPENPILNSFNDRQGMPRGRTPGQLSCCARTFMRVRLAAAARPQGDDAAILQSRPCSEKWQAADAPSLRASGEYNCAQGRGWGRP